MGSWAVISIRTCAKYPSASLNKHHVKSLRITWVEKLKNTAPYRTLGYLPVFTNMAHEHESSSKEAKTTRQLASRNGFSRPSFKQSSVSSGGLFDSTTQANPKSLVWNSIAWAGIRAMANPYVWRVRKSRYIQGAMPRNSFTAATIYCFATQRGWVLQCKRLMATFPCSISHGGVSQDLKDDKLMGSSRAQILYTRIQSAQSWMHLRILIAIKELGGNLSGRPGQS